MRPQPTTQQRPKALDRVDMDLAKAVAVLVPGVLAVAMANPLMPVAPGLQTGVDVVLVGVDEAALSDGGLDHGPDSRLLHVGQHLHHHLAASLKHAQDRRLLLLQRPSPARSLQPAPPTWTPLFATSAGFPLCPATTYTSSISTSPLEDHGLGFGGKPVPQLLGHRLHVLFVQGPTRGRSARWTSSVP